MGTYRKRKEHIGFTLEPMESVRITHVVRGNLWKNQGKHRCRVGTYGKRKENMGVVGNVRKTLGERGNLLKT